MFAVYSSWISLSLDNLILSMSSWYQYRSRSQWLLLSLTWTPSFYVVEFHFPLNSNKRTLSVFPSTRDCPLFHSMKLLLSSTCVLCIWKRWGTIRNIFLNDTKSILWNDKEKEISDAHFSNFVSERQNFPAKKAITGDF